MTFFSVSLDQTFYCNMFRSLRYPVSCIKEFSCSYAQESYVCHFLPFEIDLVDAFFPWWQKLKFTLKTNQQQTLSNKTKFITDLHTIIYYKRYKRANLFLDDWFKPLLFIPYMKNYTIKLLIPYQQRREYLSLSEMPDDFL